MLRRRVSFADYIGLMGRGGLRGCRGLGEREKDYRHGNDEKHRWFPSPEGMTVAMKDQTLFCTVGRFYTGKECLSTGLPSLFPGIYCSLEPPLVLGLPAPIRGRRGAGVADMTPAGPPIRDPLFAARWDCRIRPNLTVFDYVEPAVGIEPTTC
jgi:hypothetical protein